MRRGMIASNNKKEGEPLCRSCQGLRKELQQLQDFHAQERRDVETQSCKILQILQTKDTQLETLQKQVTALQRRIVEQEEILTQQEFVIAQQVHDEKKSCALETAQGNVPWEQKFYDLETLYKNQQEHIQKLEQILGPKSKDIDAESFERNLQRHREEHEDKVESLQKQIFDVAHALEESQQAKTEAEYQLEQIQESRRDEPTSLQMVEEQKRQIKQLQSENRRLCVEIQAATQVHALKLTLGGEANTVNSPLSRDRCLLAVSPTSSGSPRKPHQTESQEEVTRLRNQIKQLEELLESQKIEKQKQERTTDSENQTLKHDQQVRLLLETNERREQFIRTMEQESIQKQYETEQHLEVLENKLAQSSWELQQVYREMDAWKRDHQLEHDHDDWLRGVLRQPLKECQKELVQCSSENQQLKKTIRQLNDELSTLKTTIESRRRPAKNPSCTRQHGNAAELRVNDDAGNDDHDVNTLVDFNVQCKKLHSIYEEACYSSGSINPLFKMELQRIQTYVHFQNDFTLSMQHNFHLLKSKFHANTKEFCQHLVQQQQQQPNIFQTEQTKDTDLISVATRPLSTSSKSPPTPPVASDDGGCSVVKRRCQQDSAIIERLNQDVAQMVEKVHTLQHENKQIQLEVKDRDIQISILHETVQILQSSGTSHAALSERVVVLAHQLKDSSSQEHQLQRCINNQRDLLEKSNKLVFDLRAQLKKSQQEQERMEIVQRSHMKTQDALRNEIKVLSEQIQQTEMKTLDIEQALALKTIHVVQLETQLSCRTFTDDNMKELRVRWKNCGKSLSSSTEPSVGNLKRHKGGATAAAAATAATEKLKKKGGLEKYATIAARSNGSIKSDDASSDVVPCFISQEEMLPSNDIIMSKMNRLLKYVNDMYIMYKKKTSPKTRHVPSDSEWSSIVRQMSEIVLQSEREKWSVRNEIKSLWQQLHQASYHQEPGGEKVELFMLTDKQIFEMEFEKQLLRHDLLIEKEFANRRVEQLKSTTAAQWGMYEQRLQNLLNAFNESNSMNLEMENRLLATVKDREDSLKSTREAQQQLEELKKQHMFQKSEWFNNVEVSELQAKKRTTEILQTLLSKPTSKEKEALQNVGALKLCHEKLWFKYDALVDSYEKLVQELAQRKYEANYSSNIPAASQLKQNEEATSLSKLLQQSQEDQVKIFNLEKDNLQKSYELASHLNEIDRGLKLMKQLEIQLKYSKDQCRELHLQVEQVQQTRREKEKAVADEKNSWKEKFDQIDQEKRHLKKLMEQEKTDLQNQIDLLRQQLQDALKQLEESVGLKEHEEVKKSEYKKSKNIESLKAEKEKLKKELRESIQKADSFHGELKTKEKAAASSLAVAHTLQGENNKLKQKLKAQNEKQQKLIESIIASTESKSNHDAGGADSKVEETLPTANSLPLSSSPSSITNSNVDENVIKNINNAKIVELTAAMSEMEKKFYAMKQEKKKVEGYVLLLQKQLEEVKEKDRLHHNDDDNSFSLSELVQSNKSLRNEIEFLKENLMLNQQAEESLTSRYQGLLREYELLNDTNIQLIQKLQTYEQFVEQCQCSSYERVKKQTKHLQQQSSGFELQIHEHVLRISKLEETQHELEENNAHLLQQHHTNEASIVDLTKSNESLKHQLADCQERRINLEDELHQLRNTCSSTNEAKERAQQHVEDLRERRRRMDARILQLTEQIQLLEKENHGLNISLHHLEEKLEATCQLLKQSERAREEAENEQKNLCKNIKKEIQHKKEQMDLKWMSKSKECTELKLHKEESEKKLAQHVQKERKLQRALELCETALQKREDDILAWEGSLEREYKRLSTAHKQLIYKYDTTIETMQTQFQNVVNTLLQVEPGVSMDQVLESANLASYTALITQLSKYESEHAVLQEELHRAQSAMAAGPAPTATASTPSFCTYTEKQPALNHSPVISNMRSRKEDLTLDFLKTSSAISRRDFQMLSPVFSSPRSSMGSGGEQSPRKQGSIHRSLSPVHRFKRARESTLDVKPVLKTKAIQEVTEKPFKQKHGGGNDAVVPFEVQTWRRKAKTFEVAAMAAHESMQHLQTQKQIYEQKWKQIKASHDSLQKEYVLVQGQLDESKRLHKHDVGKFRREVQDLKRIQKEVEEKSKNRCLADEARRQSHASEGLIQQESTIRKLKDQIKQKGEMLARYRTQHGELHTQFTQVTMEYEKVKAKYQRLAADLQRKEQLVEYYKKQLDAENNTTSKATEGNGVNKIAPTFPASSSSSSILSRSVTGNDHGNGNRNRNESYGVGNAALPMSSASSSRDEKALREKQHLLQLYNTTLKTKVQTLEGQLKALQDEKKQDLDIVEKLEQCKREKERKDERLKHLKRALAQLTAESQRELKASTLRNEKLRKRLHDMALKQEASNDMEKALIVREHAEYGLDCLRAHVYDGVAQMLALYSRKAKTYRRHRLHRLHGPRPHGHQDDRAHHHCNDDDAASDSIPTHLSAVADILEMSTHDVASWITETLHPLSINSKETLPHAHGSSSGWKALGLSSVPSGSPLWSLGGADPSGLSGVGTKGLGREATVLDEYDQMDDDDDDKDEAMQDLDEDAMAARDDLQARHAMLLLERLEKGLEIPEEFHATTFYSVLLDIFQYCLHVELSHYCQPQALKAYELHELSYSTNVNMEAGEGITAVVLS